jgi:hypothetical protein
LSAFTTLCSSLLSRSLTFSSLPREEGTDEPAETRNRFLAGFPPFSGATADETWTNLKNWSRVLRRPHYDRPEDRIFNLSDEGWDAITWYVAVLSPISLSFPPVLLAVSGRAREALEGAE